MSKETDIACPHCFLLFTTQFLKKFTSLQFMETVYRKKRTAFLFGEQMKYCPFTKPYIECLKRRRTLFNKIDQSLKRIAEEKNRIRNFEAEMENENDLYFSNLKIKIERGISCVSTGCNGVLHALETAESVLALPMKCTSCYQQVCSICLTAPWNSTHECKPEDIASLRLIEKECKQCPRCNTQIMFVGGCSQMFCTQCHFAFDWRTLRPVRSGQYFHNPHYEAFRHSNGGRRENVFRDVASSDIDFADIDRKLKEEYRQQTTTAEEQEQQSRYMKGFLYFANELADTYGADPVQVREIRQRHKRVLFMLNELSEDKFRQMLFQTEKKHEYEDAVAVLMRRYAEFVRKILLSWTRQNEITKDEAVYKINELFAETQVNLEVLNESKKGKRTKFAVNNYVRS